MSFPALAYRAHIKAAAARPPSVFYVVPGACVPASHQNRRYAAPVSFLCRSQRLRTGLTSKPPLRGSRQVSMLSPALAYRAHIKTAATRRRSVFYVVSGACVPGSHQHRRYAARQFSMLFRRLRTGLTSKPPLRGAGQFSMLFPALAYRPHINTAATRLVSRWSYALFAEISCPNESFHPAREMEVSARRVVWPEESSPTRSSHKKRCHQTSCLARRKQPNQIKPQKTVPPDELSGQKEATQPEQAIKNGVTNKPSTLAAVADPKDSKIKP